MKQIRIFLADGSTTSFTKGDNLNGGKIAAFTINYEDRVIWITGRQGKLLTVISGLPFMAK